MEIEVYYIIMNEKGRFFSYDNYSCSNLKIEYLF